MKQDEARALLAPRSVACVLGRPQSEVNWSRHDHRSSLGASCQPSSGRLMRAHTQHKLTWEGWAPDVSACDSSVVPGSLMIKRQRLLELLLQRIQPNNAE